MPEQYISTTSDRGKTRVCVCVCFSTFFFVCVWVYICSTHIVIACETSSASFVELASFNSMFLFNFLWQFRCSAFRGSLILKATCIESVRFRKGNETINIKGKRQRIESNSLDHLTVVCIWIGRVIFFYLLQLIDTLMLITHFIVFIVGEVDKYYLEIFFWA